MLIVLVRLNGNTSQSRRSLDCVWFAEITMTCIKPTCEQLLDVDLSTSSCQCRKVQIRIAPLFPMVLTISHSTREYQHFHR